MPTRVWTAWTVLLISACGSAAAPALEVAESPAPEPVGVERSPEANTEPSLGAPHEVTSCAASTDVVAGLDPAPAVHALGEPTALVSVTRTVPRGEPVGGSVYGLVWWLSSNGRFALLVRFGAEMPRFGHHGEVAPGAHSLWLMDLSDGTHLVISQMISIAPGGGAIAYRDLDDRVWLLRQDGRRTDLSALGADDREDQNRCLNRRQVAFNPIGTTASWLARGPNRVIVEDLESGARCQVESGPGLIWRAHPMATPGWTFIHEIATDSDGDGAISFPVQNTSCACRWCNHFALSTGYYGWRGDAFEGVLIAPDGARVAVQSDVHPVGDDTVARVDADSGTLDLVDTAGAPVAIPSGCTVLTVVHAAPSVVLECGTENRLFFPDDGRVLVLPARVQSTGWMQSTRAPNAHVWVPVSASTDEGQSWQLARLRMNDGRIEAGPVLAEGRAHSGRWSIGRTADGVAMLDVSDGTVWTAGIEGVTRLNGVTISLGEERTARLAPASGRVVIGEGRVGYVDEEGCVLAPASRAERGVDRGPWQRVCPGN